MHTAQITPLYNTSETVLFFSDLLQFKITRDEKSYVILKYRDNLPSNVAFYRTGNRNEAAQLRIAIK